MGVLHSFSIKNIFYDKIDLRLFYFNGTMCKLNLNIKMNLINEKNTNKEINILHVGHIV